ncbi:hypothetical protein MPSEU_000722900 [Mayamaea pseudoterrestris]|nr:hypothetical protein MPSEU_000722900 [Mayamaea pseudoterrestris]
MRLTRRQFTLLFVTIATYDSQKPFLLASAFLLTTNPLMQRQRIAHDSLSNHPTFSSRMPQFLHSTSKSDTDTEIMDDDTILQTVTKEHLESLCNSLQLSTKGTKRDMLERLRALAQQNAVLEHQRILERKQRVEEGSEDSKERYEIINGALDDNNYEEEDEPIFYYPMPKSQQEEIKPNELKQKQGVAMITNEQITAPPIPLSEPNEKGERSVTVYSTTDQNDMTGIAAAQPGAASQAMDSLLSTAGSGNSGDQPWDAAASSRGKASDEQAARAHGMVVELVDSLLCMTGLAAYSEQMDDEYFDDDEVEKRVPKLSNILQGPIGFQPNKVSTQVLSAASQALRMDRGQVLQEVLKQFEIQAIGLDGMAGDDLEKGGGHYKELSKVRAFLEGYRRAEVRRIARETTTLLLDKLVSEGVEGLDMCLSSMTRSSDDTSDAAGELNDSLLDYLNDAIRQQEKRVEQLVTDRANAMEARVDAIDQLDSVNQLWTVSMEDGDRIESLDPNNPNVKKMLQDEYRRTKAASAPEAALPESAPEKLLLLLTLLRNRIKAEGAFGQDEKGSNLRLLAYCLKVAPDETNSMIVKEIGGSLDRLDSFIELLHSSIDYGESTSHQLQPSKKQSLNVKQLRSILKVAQKVREKQAFKAGVGGMGV